MQTRSQKYAVAVWKELQTTREPDPAKRGPIKRDQAQFNKDEYGGMAHKLPILIQACGLAQALVFVAARGKDSHKLLLRDLATVLGIPNLPERARTAELTEYMRLSQQAIEALLWFKRFAQSELNVDDASGADLDASAPEVGGGSNA